MSLLQNSNAVTPSGSYDIDNSARFNNPGLSDAAPARLTKTFGTPTNNKLWTFSLWVKRGSVSSGGTSSKRFFGAKPTSGNTAFHCGFEEDNNLVFRYQDSTDTAYSLKSSAVYRDCSAWYHCVFQFNSADGTSANRMKMWVNGEQITAFATSSYPPQNNLPGWNEDGFIAAVGSVIGNANTPTYEYGWDGLMAEVHFIDGQGLTPADFGETDEDTNQWNAIKYTGTYGNNGFFFEFKDSANMGKDTSGNSNNWGVTDLAVYDQFFDTPQNSTGGNFCTWNWLGSLNEPAFAYNTISEACLKATNHTSTGNDNFFGTIMPLGGKWYAECRVGQETSKWQFCLFNQHHSAEATAPYFTDAIRWRSDDGYIDKEYAGWTAWGSTFTTGDILMIAWDQDNHKMWFGKNGTWEQSGNPATGANPAATMSITPYKNTWTMGINYEDTSANNGTANFGQDSSFAGTETAQNNTDGEGNGDFYYTPPTGHLAVCTNNLPDPSIALPVEYFSNIIYTGNGASPSPLRVTGFQPDFVWYKQRDGGESNSLYDCIRGVERRLYTNGTAMQAVRAEGLKSFAATGFTTGNDGEGNQDTKEYVAWSWKAGGTPTTDNVAGVGNVPTAGSVKIDGANSSAALPGSIAATRISANRTSGFSITEFTGNETAGATVAHGLNVVPEWVIAKVYVQGGGASTSVWYTDPLTVSTHTQGTGSMSFDNGYYNAYTGYWNDTAPNSTVVTLGVYSNLNRSSNVIMYSFHSVDGYSKFGSYQGNGDANGKFIYLGFRPKYFLTKNMTQAEPWVEWDTAREPYNKMSKKLSLNTGDAEYTGNTTSYAVDLLSNGVKLRSSYSAVNDVNDYFFYIAFAEWPYKYARAR